jgi:uncharacterized protein involved in cysteine biosynthesis
MVVRAFAKAAAQLPDPSIRRLLGLSILISLAVFIALWVAVGILVTQTALFETTWIEAIVDVLGGAATVAITWMLFPVVITATIGLFLERVASIVESQHYPGLPPARQAGFEEAVVSAGKFLAITLVLNLMILFFLFVPPLFPFIFYGVNGYLLGREYFESVAMRRLEPAPAAGMRRRYRFVVFAAGLAIAFLLTVPFLNLVVPILGTAAMVHVFMERFAKEDRD